MLPTVGKLMSHLHVKYGVDFRETYIVYSASQVSKSVSEKQSLNMLGIWWTTCGIVVMFVNIFNTHMHARTCQANTWLFDVSWNIKIVILSILVFLLPSFPTSVVLMCNSWTWPLCLISSLKNSLMEKNEIHSTNSHPSFTIRPANNITVNVEHLYVLGELQELEIRQLSDSGELLALIGQRVKNLQNLLQFW